MNISVESEKVDKENSGIGYREAARWLPPILLTLLILF